jgi:hypothetical protein
MSHAIDIDGTAERLFILQHLAYGSKDYCTSEGILSLEHTGYAQFQSPWGWTKSVVSNYLIECSVKLRMVQEHCSKRREADALSKLDQEATLALTIGYVHEGGFRLTLREACNKIVHATWVRMDFTAADGSTEGMHFWDGQSHLFGELQGNDWHLQLDVANWAKAGMRYIGLAQEEGLLDELGQDWD